MGRDPIGINEHYFDIRRRTEKEKRDFYYVFGAWYAAGSCTESTYGRVDGSKGIYRNIKFQSRNEKLVQIVKKQLKYKGDIEFHKSPEAKDRSSRWFRVHGVDTLCDRLDELGAGVPKEEREFPKIPKKYLQDFIRGYFDAKLGIYQTKNDTTLGMKANEKIITGLKDALKEYAHVEGGGNKTRFLRYGTKDVVKIYDFIYKEKGLHLPYKKKQMEMAHSRLKGVP